MERTRTEALEILQSLEAKGMGPWRGVQIVDLRNGDIVEWLRFDGDVTELFDVALIHGVRCPRGLGSDDPVLAEVVRWDV